MLFFSCFTVYAYQTSEFFWAKKTLETWRQHEDNVETTLGQHGHHRDVQTRWGQHGDMKGLGQMTND